MTEDEGITPARFRQSDTDRTLRDLQAQVNTLPDVVSSLSTCLNALDNRLEALENTEDNDPVEDQPAPPGCCTPHPQPPKTANTATRRTVLYGLWRTSWPGTTQPTSASQADPPVRYHPAGATIQAWRWRSPRWPTPGAAPTSAPPPTSATPSTGTTNGGPDSPRD